MPLIAATDKTIYVTTTNDENGENASACSLREALKAAATNKSFGGCIAGQISGTDKIKLKDGVYTIRDTLKVEGEVSINGEDAYTYDKPDAVNNTYPGRTALKTTIQRDTSLPSFSLFNSTVSRSSLALTNIILTNGASAGNGGAIRAGGVVTLNRVNIFNSSASGSGGAIYLEGVGSALSATDTFFKGNNAVRGAVVGMSCIDNVDWTKRSITFDRTAMTENGSTSSQNMIEFCGTPTASISASTIAKNITSGNAGSAIIKYTHDQDDQSQVYVLHPASSLNLVSNTIVENNSYSALLYDNVGSLTIGYNVLAFNSGGLSCRYSAGDPSKLSKDTLKMRLGFNAIVKPVTANDTSTNDVCSFPKDAYIPNNTTNIDTNINVKGRLLSGVLNNLQDFGDTSGFLPVYLPKPMVANSGLIGLIDSGDNGACSSFDQRGLTRNTAPISEGTFSIPNPNKCDVGSIEISQLKAADFGGIANTSYVQRIDEYEQNIKYYKDLIADPKTLEIYLQYYDTLLKADQKFLEAFKNPNTYRFRQIYVSVFPNSVEEEKLDPKEGVVSEFQKFDDNLYSVTTQAVGSGNQTFMETRDESQLSGKQAIRCVWNPELKQVMISHVALNSSNQPITPVQSYETPAGQYEYCKYTIRLKSDPTKVFSSGYIQAQFANIAPVAEDDDYTVKYGGSQQIAMNLLANDNDDGDGLVGSKDYPTQRLPFFQDKVTGRFANIKILTKPQLGKLKFEYEQPCPDNSDTRPAETCYGGKLTYVADNTFSPFNDSFSYKVLDEELKESNEALVSIVNTATTTDDTRSSGGGGGSIGLIGLLGLGLLGLIRRRSN